MSGTLGYSSHGLCPRARRVHFRIFLWFSILCSYAAFIKHLLFFFSPGKVNILTSKQIRQWSWIQNNPLRETQNMKKISARNVILHWIAPFTSICATTAPVWEQSCPTACCTRQGAGAGLAQVITFCTLSAERSVSADRKLQIPHGCRTQSFWILLKYVLSEHCHIRSGTT